MPPIPEAKLTPEEERTEIELSFADVLQAWRHEYALRRGTRGEPAFKPVKMQLPSKNPSHFYTFYTSSRLIMPPHFTFTDRSQREW